MGRSKDEPGRARILALCEYLHNINREGIVGEEKSIGRNPDRKNVEVGRNGEVNEGLLTVKAMFLNNLHNTCNARDLAIRVIEEREISFEHRTHVVAR